jgi:hypothetical protein
MIALDPHHCQPCVDPGSASVSTASYHSSQPRKVRRRCVCVRACVCVCVCVCVCRCVLVIYLMSTHIRLTESSPPAMLGCPCKPCVCISPVLMICTHDAYTTPHCRHPRSARAVHTISPPHTLAPPTRSPGSILCPCCYAHATANILPGQPLMLPQLFQKTTFHCR